MTTNNSNITSSLEQSEQRFWSTFEQTPVGIAHMTPGGRSLLVNKRFCAIVGYTSDLLIAPTIQEITHPDDRNEFQEHVHLLLEGKTPGYHAEQRYCRDDGSFVWTDLTFLLVHHAAGIPDNMIGVIEDILQRRDLEERLRQSQKMESIGALAAGVVHDFNNILTVIVGNAALMQMHIESKSPLMVYLLQMLDAAERAAQLTRRLLAFSRKHTSRLVSVDFNSNPQDIKKLLLMVIGKGHEVVIALRQQRRASHYEENSARHLSIMGYRYRIPELLKY